VSVIFAKFSRGINTYGLSNYRIGPTASDRGELRL